MTEQNPFELLKRRKLTEGLLAAKAEADRRQARYDQTQRGYYDDDGVRQCGLIAFVRYFWDVLEPQTAFVDGWPLWAICEHLEAVTYGEIKRLLINVPPGFAKSLLTDVFWPAWEWGPMGFQHYRYVSFSYSQGLTIRDNDRFRTLLVSPKYQQLYGISTTFQWGRREKSTTGLVMRNTQVIKVMNQATGWKLASSVGGVSLGERGDRIIIDDPHNIQEAKSEIERNNAIRWFRESIPSRLNNLDQGAIVIIMQRLHEDDVSGVALGDDFDYCHLMIPWEFDPSRAFGDDGKVIENAIGWSDPRADPDNQDANAGEPAWLDRFSLHAMARLRNELGPYAFAAQFEQSPVPRGTGVFQPEWWKLYEHPQNFFPEFSFTCASLDGAFTQDESNDPSALTLWGIFENEGRRGVMLIGAWQKHLQFSGKRVEKRPMELHGVWRQRTMQEWGLMEWVYDSCTWLYGKPFKVDRLLIEDKGPGHSAAQELRNRYGIHDFGIQLVKTRGDKMARALAVQPIFSNGLVWAPKFDWSDMVIRQMSKFPYDRHDDLCLAAGTNISTKRGLVPIELIKVGDRVITPYGWKQVVATHYMGIKPVGTVAGLTGTANHPIFTLDSGLTRMDSITQASHVMRFTLCDLMRTIRQTMSTSRALGIDGWAGGGAIIYRNLLRTKGVNVQRGCTLRSGNFIPANPFLRVTKFTIRNGDTFDCRFENLDCLPRGQHRSMPKRIDREKQRRHLEGIRTLAAAWHKSAEGAAWHRQHAYESIRKPGCKPIVYSVRGTRECVWCGTELQWKSARKVLCSSKCQLQLSAYRRGKNKFVHPFYAASL